jgi:hypothetical protein
MHLFFVDESGRPDQDGLFALGGVAVADRDWRTLRDAWQSTLRNHGWPLDREVKWHGVRRGEVPPALADAAFAAIAAAPLTAYVVLLDMPRGRTEFPQFFASAEDAYATALMFLAERFHHLLTERDDVGMIIVDSRFRDDDARLRRFFPVLSERGTPYVKLNRIIEGLFLGPSHYSIGLQCADLVVACTASAEHGTGQARGYLRRLLPRFATHPSTGVLDGVGIKRFPDVVAPERPKTRLF